MAMTILMKQTRQGDAGAVLSVGNTYTVTKKLGAELVGVGFATDVTSALQTGQGVPVMGEINGVTGGSDILSAGAEQYLAPISIKNPSGLKRWRAALASAEYGIARVNCLADSVTMGSYSNDSGIPLDSVADVNGYVGRLRAMLARKFGATQAGYIAANDSRNTLVGTGAVTSSVGPIINTVRTNNVTSFGGTLPLPTAATITVPLPACTTIEIIYLDSSVNSSAGAIGANTGTFSYNVDATGATTTTADNVNPIAYKKVTITGLSSAAHSLVLTGVSGTCYIAGVAYYGSNGVVVSRLGLGGGTALDLTGEGVVTHLSTGSVQRIFGCYSSPVAPFIITGSVTTGSPVVTGIASTSGIMAGMPVGASAQLALPCFVQSVDSATQITLTAAATGTNAARTMYVGAGLGTYTADLWVIPIGHNDWQQQNSAYPTPVPVFKTQLQRLIDQFVGAGGCVLLVGEPRSNNALPTPETYTADAYWAALDELAIANTHVASIQINKRFGDFSSATAVGLLSVVSGVHPLKKGSAVMASTIYDAITI